MWSEYTSAARQGLVSFELLQAASVPCLQVLLRKNEEQHLLVQSLKPEKSPALSLDEMTSSDKERIAELARLQLQRLSLSPQPLAQNINIQAPPLLQAAPLSLDSLSFLFSCVELQRKIVADFVATSDTALKRWARREAFKDEQLHAEQVSRELGVEPEEGQMRERPEAASEWAYSHWFGAQAFSEVLPEDVRVRFEAMLELRPLSKLSVIYSKLGQAVDSRSDRSSLASLLLQRPSRFEDALFSFAVRSEYRHGIAPGLAWTHLVRFLHGQIPEAKKREQIGRLLKRKLLIPGTEWCSVGQVLKASTLLQDAVRDAKISFRDVVEELKQALFDRKRIELPGFRTHAFVPAVHPVTQTELHRMIEFDHKSKNTGQSLVRLKQAVQGALSDGLIDKSALLQVAQQSPQFRQLLLVLTGALDDQRTPPFVALLTDRGFHQALRKAGAMKEALILSTLGEQHRAYDQRGLTLEGRNWRLHAAKFLIHCMFGESMYTLSSEGQDRLFRSHVMGLPAGTLLDMVANVDAHQQYIYRNPEVALVERSLSTNDLENSFASIVQLTGGYKPSVEQLRAVLRNLDFTAATRRKTVDELGWYVKRSRKSKYLYHSVESNPVFTWNDGSGEDIESVEQSRYQSNLRKRTAVISKGSQVKIRDHHLVKIQERGY